MIRSFLGCSVCHDYERIYKCPSDNPPRTIELNLVEGIVQSSLSPDQPVSSGGNELPLMTESAPINFDEASYQQPIDEQSFDDISPQRKE